jgi:hypothetical protein
MKYLKKFNENKNVVEDFFKPLINFELIDNLEGMIVEFLDEDWSLYLSVRCDGKNGDLNRSWKQNEIYTLLYRSDRESYSYGTIDLFKREHIQGIGSVKYDPFEEYEKNGLNYVFSIRKRISSSMAAVHLDQSTIILKSIRSLYPNEKIDLELGFDEGSTYPINTETNYK